jgi:hypothetical protein
MKKHLLIIIMTFLVIKIKAQCDIATQNVVENFNASSSLPACWTAINGTSIQFNQLFLTRASGSQPMAILPKVLNAKGILNFQAWNTNNWGTAQITVGVVSATNTPASFVAIKSFTLNSVTLVNFSANFSTYTGSSQYVAIILSNSTEVHFDNINYQSCQSSTVSVSAQNYTIQLNSNGLAEVTPANINNGSTSSCGTPILALSKTTFNCSNIGINTVILTATDNMGHSANTTANVTILPAINNETLTAQQNTICLGNSATISTGSSVSGVNYYLRDDATNNVVDGPVVGTGNTLSFNTGTLVTNSTFNVYAETQTSGYALDFDGTNDVINTNITTSTTSSLTLEAWIYPRATTYKRIISNFKNNATQSGEFLFDTYNVTNNGTGLRFYCEGTGNVSHAISIANTLTLNIWNHVAVTFNSGEVKLYVNGIAVATSTAPFSSIPSCTNAISFGEDATIGSAEYFNGKIDEIRIWNTVRTQSEIAGNMNNCLVGNENGLSNYFKISENAGNTITDIVTGAVGTMSGMDPNTDWVSGNINCGATICNLEMTDLISINIATNPTISVNSGTVCAGNSFTIMPSGANTYTIQGGSAVVTPTSNTTYTVVGSDAAGCISNTYATSNVTVSASPIPTITVNNGTICSGNSFTITPTGANSYNFQGGNSIVSPTTTTNYSVTGYVNGCSGTAISTVSVNPVFNPSIIITESAPTGTVNTASGGTASASSTYSTNTPATAFDGNITTTGWGSGSGVPAWLAYDFGTGNNKIVSKYSIYCSSTMIGGWGSSAYNPSAWTFEGYNGTSWVVLDTRTDNIPTQNTWKTYQIANTTPYQKYRINISASANMTYVMVTEMQFFSPEPNKCSNKTFTYVSNDVSATYQWQINGNPLGTNTNSISIPYFYKNDVVTCNLTTTNTCATSSTISSNQVVLTTGAIINTSSITICSGQTYNVGSNTYNASGTYSASGTSVFGCDSTIIVNLTVNTCTGMSQLANIQNEISLFPNPSSSQISITSAREIKSILIFNSLGTIVQSEKTKSFSVAELPNGIYFAEIRTENGTTTMRFIKE